jgi:hypothetical protein
MGEAGCLKDGVFKNLQVNGNIDLENAISKSMPLRKTVVYDYAGTANGTESADAATYAQTFNLPSNAVVYAAYGYVKTANTFTTAAGNPTGGSLVITGGTNTVGITLDTDIVATEGLMFSSTVGEGQVKISGPVTITPGAITWTAEGVDTWTVVGKIVIVLDYFIL